MNRLLELPIGLTNEVVSIDDTHHRIKVFSDCIEHEEDMTLTQTNQEVQSIIDGNIPPSQAIFYEKKTVNYNNLLLYCEELVYKFDEVENFFTTLRLNQPSLNLPFNQGPRPSYIMITSLINPSLEIAKKVYMGLVISEYPVHMQE